MGIIFTYTLPSSNLTSFKPSSCVTEKVSGCAG